MIRPERKAIAKRVTLLRISYSAALPLLDFLAERLRVVGVYFA
jgi:hypothetical protein